jgi:hypothetical protein
VPDDVLEQLGRRIDVGTADEREVAGKGHVSILAGGDFVVLRTHTATTDRPGVR